MADMGIGKLGTDLGLTFKRKFRWLFSVSNICTSTGAKLTVEPFYVKTASRPNITFDEQEIHYLHGRMYLPGKPTFETITVTYYDVVSQAGNQPLGALYTWISNVYDFMSNPNAWKSAKMAANALGGTSSYGGEANLIMLDGCGNAIEKWTLYQCWPQAVNFGDLDYSSAEEATVELTLRYGYAGYESLCNPVPINPCCVSTCGKPIGNDGVLGNAGGQAPNQPTP